MKKIFFFLSLFLAVTVSAQHYYISTTGNDATGDGSISLPWQTLNKATTTVTTSGNTIHIAAGTYTETVQCVLAPGVSLEGAGRSNTIIKSSLTSDFNEMLNCRSAMGTNGNQHITGLKFDGQNTTWALIRIGGRSNFEIYNCDFINAKIHGVTFAAWNVDPNDPGFPATYCTGNKFYNNTMTNCGGWEIPNSGGNGYGNLQFGGQSGFLCYNNNIVQNRAPYNNGWPIKYWQGGYNIGCKIYNNYLQHRLQDFTLGDQNWDFAIEMFNVAGMEVYNNTIVNGAIDVNGTTTTGYNTGVGSFWCAGYGYVLYAHDNVFYCQSANIHVQTGVTLEYNIDTVIIERNTFDKFNIGVLFTPRTGNTIKNVTIHHNLFTNLTEGEGTEGYGLDFGVYSGANLTYDKINIYNNTLIASSGTPCKFGITLPNSTGTAALKNFNIKNNIIRGFYQYPLRVREGTAAIDSLDVQYNSITNCGNGNVPAYTVSPTHYTFANNNNTAPSFGTGYKLISTSPLVDAGVNVGYSYLGAAPDINWTDSTGAPPPIVCNAFDEAAAGANVTLTSNNRHINKTGFADMTAFTTTAKSSGKLYFSVKADTVDTGADMYNFFIGIANSSQSTAATPTTVDAYTLRSGTDGQWFHNGFYSATSAGGTWTNGWLNQDELFFALDFTAGTLKCWKKIAGSWILKDNMATGITGSWFPVVGVAGRPFAYTINLAPTDVPAGLSDHSPWCNDTAGPVEIKYHRKIKMQ